MDTFRRKPVNDLEKWFVDYSSLSADITIDNIIVAERPSLSSRSIQKQGSETLKSLRGSALLTFQRKVPTVQKNRNLFAAAFNTARAAVFLGLLFLVLSAGAFIYSRLNSDHFEDVPFEIYKIAFGERSNSPLASSAAKIKNLGAGGTNMSMEQTLDTQAAWKMSAHQTLKLDAIRYGLSGLRYRAQLPAAPPWNPFAIP